MRNSPLIPLRDYRHFLSLPTHILTLKRKGGHAFPTISTRNLWGLFFRLLLPLSLHVSPASAFPGKDFIKVQQLCHTDLCLTLNNTDTLPCCLQSTKTGKVSTLLKNLLGSAAALIELNGL